MEDMHIHLKEGIYSQEIFENYINKCIELKLKKVVFLDHGNRISPNHKPVLYSKNSIDSFNNIINNYIIINNDFEVLKGIEIDYSDNLSFRNETNKILNYGNFDWIVGSIHSIKFDNLGEYLKTVIDMLNNYKINAVGHLKLDDTYKKYEELLIKICNLCNKYNVCIEINTSDRAIWNDEQLKYMLSLMNDFKVKYVFSSDAHKISEIGYRIEETMRKVKLWNKKK